MAQRHLWQGEWIDDHILEHQLSKDIKYDGLAKEPLEPEYILRAIEKLSNIWELDSSSFEPLVGIFEGANKIQLDYYKEMIKEILDSKQWRDKLERETGDYKIEEDAWCTFHPYGVLLHIGVGNEIALSAYSVIEGLLAGNVNILKVPAYEKGASMEVLYALGQLEERLKPYIYALDIPSEQFAKLAPMIERIDAAVLWGGMSMVWTMRKELPPELPIIEWGHKISFAYLTANRCQAVEDNIKGMDGLVKDILFSKQNHCSSPLVLFVESEEPKALEQLAKTLAIAIDKGREETDEKNALKEGERSLQRLTRQMHETLGRERTFYGPEHYGCVRLMHRIPFDEMPFEGTIVLVPILRETLIKRLSPYRRYFQTVGLEAVDAEMEELHGLFMRLGVTRICPWGEMSSHRLSYPHDGHWSIGRLGRWVVLEG